MKRKAAEPEPLPEWTPFWKAKVLPEQVERIREAAGDAAAEAVLHSEVWRNSRFQVHIARNVPNGFGRALTHLSIKTLQAPRARHDWRELQRIKNELCGFEAEAIEIYPAESRLHDTADQFHLWVFDAGETVPAGWLGRYVSDLHPGGTGSQRRFEWPARDLNQAHHPADLHVRWVVDEEPSE